MSDRTIHGAGTAEDAWLAPAVLAGIPTTTAAALLDGAARLVVVSPHPDDEVLGCGGLLACAARAGVPVLVIAVTDGEACYPGHPHWTPDRLRAARSDELHRALATLGIGADAVLRLSMDDGAVRVLRTPLALILADALRPRDLLLAPWYRDGHPDHEAAHAAAHDAAMSVGCRLLQYPVWAWHWMTPTHADWCAARPLQLPLDAHDRQRKADALACFDTQTGHGHADIDDPVLPPHVLARFARPFEVFFR